ncbi:hypothetical protein [Kitasatospora purpeofusca]|uniref:hypothetical protein n=1 Tax=Kitasatospora purpeofusca TaxID=67352 RepID=UPI00381D0A2C
MTTTTAAAAPSAAVPTQQVAGMRWLASGTRDPEATWRVWARGDAALIRAGRGFAVIRAPELVGRTAFSELRQQGLGLIGPVLVNHPLDAVEFFVPIAPAVWPGLDAVRLDGGRQSRRMVRCPPLADRADGLDWLHPPRALAGHPAVLTDPHRLAAALTLARARLRQAGYPVAS